ncbi:dTDP-4-dehydrorhamnose reductase [Erythrobacteraceae bacterium CFH 75059]|uniref:dTDP-4-dehydrorhamnose reductase n=1 Tax=Qipengyuania thermophila TaxID=2509361 RepID=UPI00101FFA4B|nr:dTDP-4-dehydrorhamnose reductase [Qipengyuania thermophila]TCD04332.1 dTDP-4-dehydrorhamnose reductase [Erythrobacteraceae bacterium CFH 75059]
MRPILVTGGTGQVGHELARLDWPEGFRPAVLSRAEADLTDAAALHRLVTGQPWAAVINAGAYTAVDAAEGDPATAWAVNALGPEALAQLCRDRAIPLVQVSTDYVFDGTKQEAWCEDDPVGPLGVYGASKLGGELAVRASGVRHAIVRTAWVVSAHGSNFLKTMLRLAGEGRELAVVADQRGSPTAAADLAAALAAMAVRLATDGSAPSGTYHFANSGSTTWHGLAEHIFAGAAARGRPQPVLRATTTADYPTPARRPANSLLSTRKIASDYGIAPRPWQSGIDAILDELIGEPR